MRGAVFLPPVVLSCRASTWCIETFSFDTGGGAQHITQSLANVARYAPPGQTAPNFKGAIGVTADSVEGVDITVPVYHFAETHYLDRFIWTMDKRVKASLESGRAGIHRGAW